jgi:DNA-directed RNA polymerase specialized sigma24 family protein
MSHAAPTDSPERPVEAHVEVMGVTGARAASVVQTFGETCWANVLIAAFGQGLDADEAWGRFAQQYWRPLYIFCRFKGDSPQLAEDHVQGLFEGFLARNELAVLDPSRGRLRSWLMAAMEQHRTRVWRKASAQKRNPVNGFDPREVSEIEGVLEVGSQGRPDQEYQRQWALEVLERAQESLRARYRKRQQEMRFDLFWSRLLPGATSDDHASLAKTLGMTPGALATALWQFRQEYHRTLRRIVRETLGPDEDVDAEVRELIRAVA